ncbi:MAG TPA: hypothetical protein PK566_04570 [Pseudobacteroides sp.]|nr:hypothetical protein [Pseudobacteroides sp.]
MKKFVSILISGLILTIFILFNYFLWVRGGEVERYKEQVESLKEAQAKSNDARNEDYTNYKNVLRQRDDEIENLKNEINDLRTKSAKDQDSIQSLMAYRDESDRIIKKLLVQNDLTELKDIVVRWADYIDNSRYEEAFKLQTPRLLTQEDAKKRNDFIDNFRNVIQSFKLKSVDLYREELPADLKGCIILETLIEVKRVPGAIKGDFLEGLNKRYFKMSVYENSWIISDIMDYMPSVIN